MALYPRIPLSTLINYDPTILTAFYYPMNEKQDFLSYFQLEYGEMMPIYQEPTLLKEHIRVLGVALKPTIDAWLEALELEYNPIENYDRIEDETEDTVHGKGETISGGHVDSEPEHQEEHKVSADNTSNYYEADLTIKDAHSITRTYNDEKTQESGNTKVTRKGRIHGNIGTVSSQQMLQSELDLRRFNFMEEVGRLYAEKLLIMIY